MKARHTLGELLQASIGKDGLQVGHSSRLYQSCALPQFLYGLEIFTMFATHLRSAETQMNKAARNIFGKKEIVMLSLRHFVEILAGYP
jgi:hypothetical protein